MHKKLLLLVLLILPTPMVSASSYSCHATYSYPPAAYPAPVYQAPPVYQVYNNFYPVAVPTFTLGYVQPAAAITSATTTTFQSTLTAGLLQQGAASSIQGMQAQDQFERLLTEFSATRAAVEKIAAEAGGTGLMTTPNLPKHAVVLQRHCAKCHTGDTAEKGFQVFTQTGQLAQFSPEQAGKLIFRLSTHDQKLKMPPGQNKLTYEEYSQVMAGLVTQPQQASKETKPPEKDGF